MQNTTKQWLEDHCHITGWRRQSKGEEKLYLEKKRSKNYCPKTN